MKPLIDLKNLPDLLEKAPKPPAGAALEAGLVTSVDLLRLKSIARLHARGLPPDVSWSDLLQEAFARVLDGSRRCPADVPMVAFMAGVMRSIKAQHWRRVHRGTRRPVRWLAGVADLPASELADPAPSAERQLIAMEAVASLQRLFADDAQALQILSGLYEGCTPEEICLTHRLSKVAYDSARKRIRRALLRAGLRSFAP
ncbi:MAG: RNA polymerase sigma factor [Steroidobacteraceae bacterium]